MAHRLVKNPTLSRGEINHKTMERSESMFNKGVRQSKASQTLVEVDDQKAPNLWGYTDDKSSWQRLLYEPTTRQTSVSVGPPAKLAKEKMGLARMTSADPQDKKFDKQHWYAENYSKIKDASNAGQAHGEDLGKAVLTSDFFSYMERKKELEMEKEYEMWKLNQVKLTSPAARTYWQNRMPELVTKKMDYYRAMSRVESVRGELFIRGPENENDLAFMYLDGLGVWDQSDLDTVNAYLDNRGLDWIWQRAVTNGSLLDQVNWNIGHENFASVPNSQ